MDQTRKLLNEDDDLENEPEILGGGSTLADGFTTADAGETQEGKQRDLEPDDYDGTTDVNDDRVRGAGEQSLEELTITQGLGLGLEEHIGGLRSDRPDKNVNDPDPEEYVQGEAV